MYRLTEAFNIAFVLTLREDVFIQLVVSHFVSLFGASKEKM